MKTTNGIKLTTAQRAAAITYLLEDAHETAHAFKLTGSRLSWSCSDALAWEIVTEAANSADVGDNETPDRGASTALSNIARMISERPPQSRFCLCVNYCRCVERERAELLAATEAA